MREQLSQRSEFAQLISASAIAKRVEEMGQQISADYRGKPLVATVILRGAFVFASDLIRHLDPGIQLHVEFVRASSYHNEVVSSRRVELTGPDPSVVAESHVLVIEDVLDTGRTLRAVTGRLRSMGPASIEVAALLSKDRDGREPTAARYVGFDIPNVFVVGYGLDAAQNYRHLPDIRILTST